MSEMNDKELLDALGIESTVKAKKSRTPREERIISGLEDIEHFFEQNGRLPNHGENKDIFERIYAVRLDQISKSKECRDLLVNFDKHGLLSRLPLKNEDITNKMNDKDLLTQLGVSASDEVDITKLRHVKSRAEIRESEEIARRIPCPDFDKFKPFFLKVQEELNNGVRKTVAFKNNAQIKKGDLFILSGQKVYVAETGEEFINDYDRTDRRLRVVYDNGTESDILMRSLQRALNKDEIGRRITNPSAGPLFSGVLEKDDDVNGTIYVLRSKSEYPQIKENKDIIHKIGVTSGNIKKRLSNAKYDPTFLMSDVEVVATYELSNIHRTKLEKLIQKIFQQAKLDIEIKDRFGNPIKPQEWFLVPLFVIDEVIEKIRDGTITDFFYDPNKSQLVRASNE